MRWSITRVGPTGRRIKWFDGQDNFPVTAKAMGYPSPSGWDKTVEAVLAHHVTTHLALGKAASEIYARARIRMAAHRDTGAARVGMEKGWLDYRIYLEDPDPGTSQHRNRTGKRSALSIEFGHRVRGSDERVGGLYIITGAASAAGSWNKRWDK